MRKKKGGEGCIVYGVRGIKGNRQPRRGGGVVVIKSLRCLINRHPYHRQ
jgi:hypothetical protein